MKLSSFSFLAFAVLLHSPLYCMEAQPLLGAKYDSRDILNKPLSRVFPPGTLQRPAPVLSQSLADVLKQRNPDDDPLFAHAQRAANTALITSIGAHNARVKLLGLATLILTLNAAKDFTALQVWGKLPQYPPTELTPPSHLMPLKPCHQICDLVGCCFGDCTFGPDCQTICSDQWDCSRDTPLSIINELGNKSIVSLSANGLAAAITGSLAVWFWHEEGKAEKALEALLNQLDNATQGLPNLSIQTPSPNPIQEVLDKSLAQALANQDQMQFDQKRQAFIHLMKANGSGDAKFKLCALLATIFGLNLAKDLTLGHIWGFDTTYPITPLIPPNHLMPLTTCKQICWATGCCNILMCPITNETCRQACASQCVEETNTRNSFGYTSMGTSIANLVGLLASVWGSIHYSRKTNTIQEQIQQRFQELDQLIASANDNIE